MKALTIDAWWAWAIVFGPKRVENRSWRTKYRGPLAIHAGLNKSRDAEAIAFLQTLDLVLPADETIDALRGQVIGACELVDCVGIEERETLFPTAEAVSPFAFGPQCWLLENVRALENPVRAIGMQCLWNWQPPAEFRL